MKYQKRFTGCNRVNDCHNLQTAMYALIGMISVTILALAVVVGGV